MIDAKGIIHELNQPTWKTEVKPKRTNRDVFLNGITNRNIARIILKEVRNVGCTCCPVVNQHKECGDDMKCVDRIEKWLGEYAND